jgi:2-polyprenyl-3-methyl-5-hydroxy-6-metoxy-1,4-benzoquinol methylase
MSTIAAIEKFVSNYKATNMGINDFLNEVSNAYHQLEAKEYDERHVDIIGNEQYLINCVQQQIIKTNTTKLKILDYGCGTGFAANALLKSKLLPYIESISLYDLSPDMVAMAKQKLQHAAVPLYFYDNINGLEQLKNNQFDMVITNALVHHIPELEGFFAELTKLVKPGGYYLLSHEPNAAFYKNKALLQVTNAFSKFKKNRNRLNLNYWLFKLKIKKSFNLVRKVNILAATNLLLLEKGVISKPFPEKYIPKLIDVHVPIFDFDVQPWGEVGFSAEHLIVNYLHGFNLVHTTSYSHIKAEAIVRYKKWMEKDKLLSQKYPLDGADVLMLFQKK